jgi:hypothetical protein
VNRSQRRLLFPSSASSLYRFVCISLSAWKASCWYFQIRSVCSHRVDTHVTAHSSALSRDFFNLKDKISIIVDVLKSHFTIRCLLQSGVSCIRLPPNIYEYCRGAIFNVAPFFGSFTARASRVDPFCLKKCTTYFQS